MSDPTTGRLGSYLLVAMVFSVGCAAKAPVTPPRPPGPVTVLRRVLAASTDSEWFEIRYNPTSCKCPEFELRLPDRWVRVELSPSPEERGPTNELRVIAKRDLRDGTFPTYTVFGSLDDSVMRCETNALVAHIDVRRFSMKVPPPEAFESDDDPGDEPVEGDAVP